VQYDDRHEEPGRIAAVALGAMGPQVIDERAHSVARLPILVGEALELGGACFGCT
jgi:hypothetical protein